MPGPGLQPDGPGESLMGALTRTVTVRRCQPEWQALAVLSGSVDLVAFKSFGSSEPNS